MDEQKPVENTSENLSVPDSLINQIEISNQTLSKLSGWATFIAVMNIITGIFSCLSCIMLAPGILSIIAGVKLFSGIESINEFIKTKDNKIFTPIFENFKKYFQFAGISLIIQIALIIIFIIIYIVVIVYFVSNAASGFNGLGKYFNNLK